MNGNHKEMAIVIPTMGRPVLLKTLESLLAIHDITRAEIVVVGVIPDKDILSALQKIVNGPADVRHLSIRFDKGDASLKRNAGADATSAPILAFLDDDVHVPDNWLDNMISCFADESVALVSGPSLVPKDLSWLARLAGQALSSKAAGDVSARYSKGSDKPRLIKWSGIIGCNMLFRRSVFKELGGFNPGFYPGEEMLAAFRTEQSGRKILFSPNAPVYHYPKQTFRGFWKQLFRYGATRIRLIRAGVDVQLAPLIPGIWLLSLVVLGIGSVWSVWCLRLLVLELVLYAAVIAWFTLDVVFRSKRVDDLILFVIQPFMHLSYGIGIWSEIIHRDKDLSDALGRPTD